MQFKAIFSDGASVLRVHPTAQYTHAWRLVAGGRTRTGFTSERIYAAREIARWLSYLPGDPAPVSEIVAVCEAETAARLAVAA